MPLATASPPPRLVDPLEAAAIMDAMLDAAPSERRDRDKAELAAGIQPAGDEPIRGAAPRRRGRIGALGVAYPHPAHANRLRRSEENGRTDGPPAGTPDAGVDPSIDSLRRDGELGEALSQAEIDASEAADGRWPQASGQNIETLDDAVGEDRNTGSNSRTGARTRRAHRVEIGFAARCSTA